MIRLLDDKIYNAYMIETYNYENVKKIIIEFAVHNGFDKKLIDAGTHPDIIFLEQSDKLIPVDEVRSKIINTVNYTPKISDRKFYIIYDAKNLNEVSQNAMLKTLEEPPDFVSFFLITKNINSILYTIRSRCQVLKDNDDIDYKEILDIDYLDSAINIFANIKFETIGDKMNFVDNVVEKDVNLKKLIRIYRIIIRDALMYKITLSKKKIFLREKEEQIIQIANTFTLEELGRFIDKLDRMSLMNEYPVNKKLVAFNFLEV